jgi:hypothetical protein
MGQTTTTLSWSLALLLTATTAIAGTPLPDPPFSDGGFVAPSKDVLRQEEAVNKALSNYAKKRTVCDWIAVTGLQLAYTPVNAGKVAAIEAKWTACLEYADEYYVKHRDRVLAKGTPACLDQAGFDAQRAAVDDVIQAVASQVYCDDGGAAPDPVTGLNIPDKKQETIGETQLAKIALKAQQRASKCYSKGASLALKLGGVFTQREVDRVQSCLDRVTSSAASTIDDLDQTQKLPACLSVGAAEAAVAEAVAFSGSSTSVLYCAE